MSIFTRSKINTLFIKSLAIIALFSSSFTSAAPLLEKSNFKTSKVNFTPPPIPPVRTPELVDYVKKYHTFPSPFGYEPYLDEKGNELSTLLTDLNPDNSYIPVTFYCKEARCPTGVLYQSNSVQFIYPENQGNVTFEIKANDGTKPNALIGFYFPDDPKLYNMTNAVNVHGLHARKGEPLLTILFSQRVLQDLSQTVNGKLKGHFVANGTDINLPSIDGKETLKVGTTLSLLGLGQASGVEFSESVQQTLGQTNTSQVQTGFSVSTSIGDDFTLGGGNVPIANTFRASINKTLSTIVSNGVAVTDITTVTRTYTIKPGIYDTYYWAIYQLLYSYRIHAPLLDEVFKQIQTAWQDKIELRISDNQSTQDKKLIGNLIPPQGPNLECDITVGVAIPVNPASTNVFSELIKQNQ